MNRDTIKTIKSIFIRDIVALVKDKGEYSDMLEVNTIRIGDDVTVCINGEDYLVREVCVDGCVIPGEGVVNFDRLGLESDLLPLLEYLEGL